MNEFEIFALKEGWKGARFLTTYKGIDYYLCIRLIQEKGAFPSLLKKVNNKIVYATFEEAIEVLGSLPDEE